jgi:lipoprotein-releasing system permease protein
MNLSLKIARRYLFAKKSHNAINIITLISVIVVAVGATAMVIILSVFNGLEGLITQLYGTYNPDLQITPAKSKYINIVEFNKNEIDKIEGIANYSEIIEDVALLKYTPSHKNSSRQIVAKLKAVPDDYAAFSGIDSMIIDGSFSLKSPKNNFIILGNGLASNLQLSLNDILNPISVYYPNQTAKNINMINPLNAFMIENVYATGVFSIQQEIDNQLAFVSLDFAKKLMKLEDKATSIEIFLDKNTNLGKIQSEIEEKIGQDYKVRNSRQQNDVIYKIMKSEKWSSFLILSFIMLIATFNIVGSVTVLVIEKKKDIQSLSNMGASQSLIKKIFFFEGIMISFFGSILGLFLGLSLVLAQKHLQIIPMEGSFIVDAFPVSLNALDFFYVFLFVNLIGLASVLLPLRRISKEFF